MKKNFLLLILFLIFVISFITLLMIFNYLDPYEYRAIALVSMGISLFLSLASFSTLCIYGFKRIYFRGQVFIGHVMTSFRQSVLLSFWCIGTLIFASIQAPILISGFLLAVILVCAELFIKNMKT